MAAWGEMGRVVVCQVLYWDDKGDDDDDDDNNNKIMGAILHTNKVCVSGKRYSFYQMLGPSPSDDNDDNDDNDDDMWLNSTMHSACSAGERLGECPHVRAGVLDQDSGGVAYAAQDLGYAV